MMQLQLHDSIHVVTRHVPFLGSGADFGLGLGLVLLLVLNEERFEKSQKSRRSGREFCKIGSPIFKPKSVE